MNTNLHLIVQLVQLLRLQHCVSKRMGFLCKYFLTEHLPFVFGLIVAEKRKRVLKLRVYDIAHPIKLKASHIHLLMLLVLFLQKLRVLLKRAFSEGRLSRVLVFTVSLQCYPQLFQDKRKIRCFFLWTMMEIFNRIFGKQLVSKVRL